MSDLEDARERLEVLAGRRQSAPTPMMIQEAAGVVLDTLERLTEQLKRTAFPALKQTHRSWSA